MDPTQDPALLRDKGLEFLHKGKEIFNNNNQLAMREKGYDLYKRGLECLIKYLKLETNPSIQNKVKANLKTWMEDAKSMEHTLFQNKANAPTNINTKPTAPISNQPTYPTNPTKPSNPWTPGGYQPTPGGYQPTPGGYQPTPGAPKEQEPSPKPSSKNGVGKDGKKLKVGDDDNDKMMSNLEAAIVTEKPDVRWEDIAGLEQAKKSLQEAVIYPIKFPNLFVGMRTPWKGILLYGPPGTGKTFLAKACATEADATFFSVSAADVTSKYVGESEKLIKTLFKMAREKKPAIIFIDEIDSLLSARSDNENEASRRVKTEFLVQMQGVGHDDTGILVLGATNIPWALDSAVRRRFEKRIYIPLPDSAARLALLRQQLKKTPMALEADDVQYLAERTNGYSCADMNILIRDASYQPLRKAQNATHFKVVEMSPSGKPIYVPCPPSDPQGQRMKMFDLPGDQLTLPPITMDDFEVSLLKTKPSVSQADLTKQIEFTKSFGIEG